MLSYGPVFDYRLEANLKVPSPLLHRHVLKRRSFMRTLYPVVLLLIAILIPLSSQRISADQTNVRYNIEGIVISNNTVFTFGSYKIRAINFVPAGFTSYVNLYVTCPNGHVITGTLHNPGDTLSIYSGCSSYQTPGAQLIFKIRLNKTEVPTQGEAYIYLDILDCITKPVQTLRISSSFPANKSYELASTFTIPVNVTNICDSEVSGVKVSLSWNKLDGRGNITLLSVAPAVESIKNPLLIDLGTIGSGESQSLKFVFKADPGGKYYGKYGVFLTLTYKTDYTLVKNSSGVLTYKYTPNKTISETKSFTIVVGEKYRGHLGAPNLKIYTYAPASTKLLVNPGDVLTFRFYIKNLGEDSALNGTLYVKVQPQTSKGPFPIITQPSTIAGKSFPINLPEIPKLARTQTIEFTLGIPKDSAGTIYQVSLEIDYTDIRGNIYNTSKTYTIEVKKPGYPYLVVTKTLSTNTVGVQQTLDVVVTVKNNGTAPALSVQVVDTYPTDYFQLVSGKTTTTVSKLNPGDSISLTYKLKATRTGVTSFGIAKVTYKDPQGLTKVATSSGTPLTVSIVKPSVSVILHEKPPSSTVVGSVFPVSFSISNSGTGTAYDFEMDLKLSSSLRLMLPPSLTTTVKAQCSPPSWTPHGNVSYVRLSCSKIDPTGNVELRLVLKADEPGNYSIEVTKMVYTQGGTNQKYSLDTSKLNYEISVMTPIEMRLFSAALLALWIFLVVLFVMATTRGLPFRTRVRGVRRRFGVS